MSYDKELAAAKKAATLAARLCQACHSTLSNPKTTTTSIAFFDILFLVLYVWFRLLFQKVQKALLQSDVHSKSDKSPVTVADYG
jgi:3'(2'), 5'-bisphosphate nucleotidase/inositol polyphosphate 1-phosphatase